MSNSARLTVTTILALAIAVALVLVLATGTGVVLAEDHPNGDAISPTQTISGTWGPGVITATADVTINSTVAITIAPHTTILVADGIGFTVQGDLHSDGPLTFTTASSPAVPGVWEGITYAAGSTGYLNEATVEYAEHALVLGTPNPIAISNSIIRHNKHAPPSNVDAFGAGIAITSGAHLVTNTQVYENILISTGDNGKAFGGGIDIQGTGSQIINSLIYRNAVTSTNNAIAVGGGIAIRGSGNSSLIEGCQVTSNTLRTLGATSGHAGGIGINNVTAAVISDSLIAGNFNYSHYMPPVVA